MVRENWRNPSISPVGLSILFDRQKNHREEKRQILESLLLSRINYDLIGLAKSLSRFELVFAKSLKVMKAGEHYFSLCLAPRCDSGVIYSARDELIRAIALDLGYKSSGIERLLKRDPYVPKSAADPTFEPYVFPNEKR